MKIIFKKGKNIKEEIVDDSYFNITAKGLECAMEDIAKLIGSNNLHFYMNQYVVRESMNLYGNTYICVEKLRHKLITLLYYMKDLKLENNTVEYDCEYILCGLSAITKIYCGYNLIPMFNQDNYEVEEVINNFIKHNKKHYDRRRY